MNDLSDNALIALALNNHANYIETGDISLSAIDAESMKKPFKALSRDQMKLVIRLRDLSDAME